MSKKNLFRYAFATLLIIILWYILSISLNTPAFPDPASAMVEFIKISDRLYAHIIASLFRILLSVFLSIILSMPIGLLLGRSRLLDFLFSPVIYMLYPVPKIAFLPVVMLILGLGNASKIFLIFIIVFFQIIVTCRDEASRIRKEQFFFMESIGASQLDIFYHLVLPHSLPAIFTSIRLSLGTSIAILFFSENYGTDKGIGYFIMDSWMRINYPEMFAGIIGLSLMGIILFLLVDALEKKICPWTSK